MHKDDKIYVAGHRGLAGSAILHCLKSLGYRRLITRTHADLDLLDQAATENFFMAEKPDYVFLAAAKVGGIHANQSYPAEFIFQNLTIQNHVIHQCYTHGVKRLLFLGSSCIYPKLTPQPIKEEQLLSGPLEPTNAAYAVAKIAGIEMCRAYNRQHGTHFLPVMPTNLFGPGDNFDLQNSHVLPALIRKINLAKLASNLDWPAITKDEMTFGPIPDDIKRSLGIDPRSNLPVAGISPSVVLWGTGQPRREFLLSDDLADACVYLMSKPWDEIVGQLNEKEELLFNIGSGVEHTIHDLAVITAKIIGYKGQIEWDHSMPDGTPCKLLDISRSGRLGWRSKNSLADGIQKTYQWYLDQTDTIR